MSKTKQPKLVQREISSNGHNVYIRLIDLGYNTMMIPLMTREDLNDLRTAIDEVLKHSKRWSCNQKKNKKSNGTFKRYLQGISN